MKFFRVDSIKFKKPEPNSCFFVNDNWDDFGFKTSFGVILCDDQGLLHDLGSLKAIPRDWANGRVPVPDEFKKLGREWCTLGVDRDYYVKLTDIKEDVRKNYLKSVRDCVYDHTIYESFKNQQAMKTSLLRGVHEKDVLITFPRVLSGIARRSSFKFNYDFHSGANNKLHSCKFEVDPRSKPPTNIHVLIGRNGVGKTRLLAGMADALTANKATSIGIPGSFNFDEAHERQFLNLIVVAYSAFDKFDPIPIKVREGKAAIPYCYIGIKAHSARDDVLDTPSVTTLKNSDDFSLEFKTSLTVVQRDSGKRERWLKALNILCSDPGIAEFQERVDDSKTGWEDLAQSVEQFALASSGHKIVLLSLTRLVEHVSDRSIVLLDEPETHLHPPLLGSFIRAISELLISQNGVAIVATHSPVVLQEVPSKCVLVVTRSGGEMSISRPDVETFAENVGSLTRKVFGLEVTQSGFYRLLKQAAEGQSFEEIIKEFDEQIGGEGRALARVFAGKREKK
ncbi:MAG: hypothetical protein CTY31_12515 [Hyphomicrobium sp.]|nr:MAG: hypothetical protein CTY39_09395 [Hyphomicrobium sp.]PPC98582.1 MAG: hypothetical protein CTY31_12515 [Hyphomicrobium sp.]